MKSFIVQSTPSEVEMENIVTIKLMENDDVTKGLKDGTLSFDFAVGDTRMEYDKLCYLLNALNAKKHYEEFIKGDRDVLQLVLPLN